MNRRRVQVWTAAILLQACSASRSAALKTAFEECVISVDVDCDESNADVLVKAEILITSDGLGTLKKIVGVEPSQHPVAAEAIEMAKGPHRYESGRPEETVIEIFAYCQNPPTTITRFGSCRH